MKKPFALHGLYKNNAALQWLTYAMWAETLVIVG